MRRVDREKIVARPAQFQVGDIVQTLVEGVRFEIVRVKTGAGTLDATLTHEARPAWTEELASPADRDHVVERHAEYVEAAKAPHPAEVKLAKIRDALDAATHDGLDDLVVLDRLVSTISEAVR